MLFNYAVTPALLETHVPKGTELDLWEGNAWVSLFGLTLKHTRAFGIPVPFQQDYAQVGLRLYVKRTEADGPGVRRGVVLIREIVPHLHVALAGRTLYNERYVALPMQRSLSESAGAFAGEYAWQSGKTWNRMRATAGAKSRIADEGSHEEFIAQRWWGYTPHEDGTVTELELRHPSWRYRAFEQISLELPDMEFFGRDLARVLSAPPTTAFLAEGSPVIIRGVHKLQG